MVHVMLFSMLKVLYFYLLLLLLLLVIIFMQGIYVAPAITGITFDYTFHMC
jgi:hypothetical protein